MRRNWAMANEALSFSRISVVDSVILSLKISLFRPSENCGFQRMKISSTM
jgi:hypothetical protein